MYSRTKFSLAPNFCSRILLGVVASAAEGSVFPIVGFLLGQIIGILELGTTQSNLNK
jgi:hypothetical protein